MLDSKRSTPLSSNEHVWPQTFLNYGDIRYEVFTRNARCYTEIGILIKTTMADNQELTHRDSKLVDFFEFFHQFI